MEIDGGVEPGFDSVAEAFEHNFDELEEIGAAVAVFYGGRLVVDLAAGRDPVFDRPFTRDSLLVVASCTKAAAATCVLMLAEAGAIDLDAPVARYWPEFAQAGKSDIPVRWALSHQAGLPYPDPRAACPGSTSWPARPSCAGSNSRRRGGRRGPRSPITRSRRGRCWASSSRG